MCKCEAFECMVIRKFNMVTKTTDVTNASTRSKFAMRGLVEISD